MNSALSLSSSSRRVWISSVPQDDGVSGGSSIVLMVVGQYLLNTYRFTISLGDYTVRQPSVDAEMKKRPLKG